MGDGGLARIRHEVVKQMRAMGNEGYTYALERLIWYRDRDDESGVNLWQDILTEMKQGEGQ